MKTYTTSRGVKIEFMPIARETMQRFQHAHPEPEPPSYEVVAVGGVKERHAHNETTISTPEEKAAWETYQTAKAERALHFVRFFVLRGLKVHSTMDDWQEEQAFLGIPLPANKAELKFAWVSDCVLSTPEDYQAVMLGVMGASGVEEGLLQQIEASFRGQIQGDAVSGTTSPNGTVDDQPGV